MSAEPTHVPRAGLARTLWGTPTLRGIRVVERKLGSDERAPRPDEGSVVPYEDAIVARLSDHGNDVVVEHDGRIHRVAFSTLTEGRVARRMWARSFDRATDAGDASISVWPARHSPWVLVTFLLLFGSIGVAFAVDLATGTGQYLFQPAHPLFPDAARSAAGLCMAAVLCGLGVLTGTGGPRPPFRAAIRESGLTVIDQRGPRDIPWASVQKWERSRRGGIAFRMRDRTGVLLNGPECIATVPMLLRVAPHAAKLREAPPIRRLCMVAAITALACAGALYYVLTRVVPGVVPPALVLRQALILALLVPGMIVFAWSVKLLERSIRLVFLWSDRRKRAKDRETRAGRRVDPRPRAGTLLDQTMKARGPAKGPPADRGT